MNPKKFIYYILLDSLALAASLITGLLSFGGIFVLWPIISVSVSAAALVMVYEGQIYLQNIKGALNKLFFNTDYLKLQFAKEYLKKKLSNTASQRSSISLPVFLQNYIAKIHFSYQFENHKLSPKQQKQWRKAQQNLQNMEEWFANQLCSTQQESNTDLEAELKIWLTRNEQTDYIKNIRYYTRINNAARIFSVFSAVFMAVGTSYLLIESFAIIPILVLLPLTILPFVILPMALIAGAAYGLLTFNALTDLINNRTLNKWYQQFVSNFSQGFRFRTVFNIIATVSIISIALALTLCTAGTWWTIVRSTRPLFNWMLKIPSVIINIIHPMILGMSALIFNLENTNESLELIDDAMQIKSQQLQNLSSLLKNSWYKLRASENWLQIINPPRLLLTVTYTPLRIFFYLAHLIIEGMTADRVPKISEILSTLLGFILGFFADLHNFFPHAEKEDIHGDNPKDLIIEHLELNHESEHHHDNDLPARILKFIFKPLFAAAAAWDSAASQLNNKVDDLHKKPVLTFAEAAAKINDEAIKLPLEEEHIVPEEPQTAWDKTYTLYAINKFRTDYLQHVKWNKDIAIQKSNTLSQLQNNLLNKPQENIPLVLHAEAQNKNIYNQHRYSFFNKRISKTATENFLDQLADQISAT